MTSRRGVNQELEKIVRKCFYANEEDAEQFLKQYRPNEEAQEAEEVSPE